MENHDTNHLTCNRCASDIDLCKCPRSVINVVEAIFIAWDTEPETLKDLGIDDTVYINIEQWYFKGIDKNYKYVSKEELINNSEGHLTEEQLKKLTN